MSSKLTHVTLTAGIDYLEQATATLEFVRKCVRASLPQLEARRAHKRCGVQQSVTERFRIVHRRYELIGRSALKNLKTTGAMPK
jgi:hypothetical protein